MSKIFKIKFFSNYQKLSKTLARAVLDLINRKSKINIFLPACHSPLGLYKYLVDSFKKRRLDIDKINFFNLDFPVGLNLTDPRNFTHYMFVNFYGKIFFPRRPKINGLFLKNFYRTHKNFNMLCLDQGTKNKELIKIANNYKNKIEKLKTIDLVILGIGVADKKLVGGHLAFNEPGSSLDSETRTVDLRPLTIKNKFLKKCRLWDCKKFNYYPTQAITIGIKDILRAEKIFLIVNKKTKKKELRKLLQGKIDQNFPASYLNLVKDKVTIFTVC